LWFTRCWVFRRSLSFGSAEIARLSGAAFPVSVFREAPSLIRDSMEFNTRVSMSCELGIVRCSILVSLVNQEPKILCEAFSRIVGTLCEENAVLHVV
jgi:hypothetical protein